MWNPIDEEARFAPWGPWEYLRGGPSYLSPDERAYIASRVRRRPFDFPGNSWDGGAGGLWTMGNPGSWANPSSYDGPGSWSNPGFGGFSRHLGHVGPPVEETGRWELHSGEFRGGRPGRFTGKGPKGYQRSDDRIREDVCEALMSDGAVDASDIEVEVRDGEVTLSGTIGDRGQKRRAERVAESCSGVADVHNVLRIGAGEASSERRRAVGA